jgi:hypothetical protein
VADHYHESYEIHGAATGSDVADLSSYVSGVREDLGHAEERIRALEDRVSTLQWVLSAHLADAGQPVAAQAVSPE